jgi:hypothetical protein
MSHLSCNLTENDIVGKYVAKHNLEHEYIDILPNNKYYHYIIVKSDTIKKHSGTWNISGKSFFELLTLNDFITYYDIVTSEKVKEVSVGRGTFCDGKTIGGYDTGEYQYFRVDK